MVEYLEVDYIKKNCTAVEIKLILEVSNILFRNIYFF